MAVLQEQASDRYSRRTWRMLELLSGGLTVEQTPPWEWLCQLAGIRDLDTFAEVWIRLGIYRRILDERQRKTTGPEAPSEP